MSESQSVNHIDVTAPTLEQAIKEGLERLGLSRNDVIIEIVEEGSRGVLGMGQREAVVRLTPLRPPATPIPQPEPEPEPEPEREPEPEPEPEPAAPVQEAVSEAPAQEDEEDEIVWREVQPEDEIGLEEEDEEEEIVWREVKPATEEAAPEPEPEPEPAEEEIVWREIDPATGEIVEHEHEHEPEPEPEPELELELEPEPEPEPELEFEFEPEPELEPVPERPPTGDEATSQDAQLAEEALHELLDHMGLEGTSIDIYHAEPASPEEEAPWILNIEGEDLGILIGRRGETLNALQYITRLIVSRELQRRANIVIDVEDYKARREATLERLARKMAEQAKRLGDTITLEPMPPNERRVIHVTLRGDEGVETESIGSGDGRKVTIIPVKE